MSFVVRGKTEVLLFCPIYFFRCYYINWNIFFHFRVELCIFNPVRRLFSEFLGFFGPQV